PWRRGRDGGCRKYPVSKQRGTCQSPRAAAGASQNGEPLNAEMIGNSAGISGRGGNGCAAVRAGASVAGSVITDPTNAQRIRDVEERLRRSTRVRCAAMPQQDQLIRPAGGSNIVRVQNPAIGCGELNLEQDRL